MQQWREKPCAAAKTQHSQKNSKESPKDFSFLPVKNTLAVNQKILHRVTKFLLYVNEKPSRPNQHVSREVSLSHFFLAKKLVKFDALEASLRGRHWMKRRKCVWLVWLGWQGNHSSEGLQALSSTGRRRAPPCGGSWCKPGWFRAVDQRCEV